MMLPQQGTDKENGSGWRFWAPRAGIFIAGAILVTGMLVFEYTPSLGRGEFAVGEPAPRTLFSPFDLTCVDEKTTEDLRLRASSKVLAVYRIDPILTKAIRASADQFFEMIHEAKKNQGNGTAPQDAEPLMTEDLPFEISDASLRYLMGEPELEKVRKNLELLFERSLAQGIMAPDRKLELIESGAQEITVTDPAGGKESAIGLGNVLSLEQAYEIAKKEIPDAVNRNRNLKKAILDIFQVVVDVNLVFDGGETQIRRLEAAEAIAPVEQYIKKDELIVQRGMLITPEDKYKIDQVQMQSKKQQILHQLSAVGLLVFLVYVFCFVYMFMVERKQALPISTVLLTHTVFFLTVALCKIISVWPGSSPYLMPTALASLLLALLVNIRMGLMAAAVMAILLGPLAGFRADLILATFLASAGGTFAVIRLRKRIEFIRVGLILGLTYFLVLFAFQLWQELSVWESLLTSALGYANGLLITVPLLFILVSILEYVFGLATDISLLEMSDLNHPLLKRMVIEAPGTYHHSLVVSRLAESACEAIGANALLARVGCYFHDIGKISRSEYFTENQTGHHPSLHEKLSPAMSCRLIVDHIKSGINLGRKHKLKACILQFIQEHQGSCVVYYFYRKALDQADPGQPIESDDFRYPGPKPQTRETAVALLADSVEAASRSLKTTTPGDIRGLVRKVINDKFIDGQLDECDLTLRDLLNIQDSFVHNLMAIHHSRISYPDSPDSPDQPDLFQEGQHHKFRLNP